MFEPRAAPPGHLVPLFAGWRWELALGFVYWLAFVLVLEPGNVLSALRNGASLPVGREILRLLGAGVLGAAVTPLVFALTRRFPVEGGPRWRNATIHAACDFVLAAAMIVVAGLLASLGLDRRPLWHALREQLVVDGLLLFFCLIALTGIAHAVYFVRRAQDATHLPAAPPPGAPPESWLTRIPVKSRGQVALLDAADIDWIETQGNYLALHVGTAVHLIRETSLRLQARLDPDRFVRIHRSYIVNFERVVRIEPYGKDSRLAILADGTRLPVSRAGYARLKTLLDDRA